MGRFKEIVIDADHPARLARFWQAALDGYAIRPYDDEEIARLAGLGLTPDTDPSVMLDGTDPGAPTLCFQLRRGPRPWRNRLHLDLAAANPSVEVTRLLALGASAMRRTEGYTALKDPEGNQFCVVSER